MSLVHVPSCTERFAIHNDYFVKQTPRFELSPWPPSGLLVHRESWHLLAVGRPLNAVLFNIQQSLLVGGVERFALARFASMLTSVLCAVLYMRILRVACGIDSSVAFTAAFTTFVLPSCLLYVLWSTNFVPGVLNVLIVLVAYCTFDASFDASRTRRHRRILRSLGIGLLSCSFLIYHPTTLFFLVPTFVRTAVEGEADRTTNGKVAIRDAAAVLVGMAGYYLFNVLVLFPLLAHFDGERYSETVRYITGTYRFALPQDLSHLPTVARGFLLIAWPLWHADIDALWPRVLTCVVLLASGLVALHRRRPGTWWPSCVRLSLLVSLFVLSLAPVLLPMKDEGVPYRTVFPAIAMLSFLFVQGVLRLAGVLGASTSQTRTAVMLVASGAVAAIAWGNVSAMAASAGTEYEVFRRAIEPLRTSGRRALVVVELVPEGAVFVPRPLHRDLALNASNSEFMWPIVMYAAEEFGVARERIGIVTIEHDRRHEERTMLRSEPGRNLIGSIEHAQDSHESALAFLRDNYRNMGYDDMVVVPLRAHVSR